MTVALILDPPASAATRRTIPAFLMAGIITFALFFVMQLLVAEGHLVLDDSARGQTVWFREVSPDSEIETNPTELPEKPVTEEPPEPFKPTVVLDQKGVGIRTEIPPVIADLGDGISLFGPIDGELVTIVAARPIYPSRAISSGIEGYVILRFDVNPMGIAENIVVVGAEPVRVFDKAAIKAMERFKFRPRVVDGVAQRVIGQLKKFTFEIEEG